LASQILPSLLILSVTVFFLAVERLRPGRGLPHSTGWYIRAFLLNFLQLVILGVAGITWNSFFRGHAFLFVVDWGSPILEGFFFWFIGTFVFYWWHRLRHQGYFWRILHQIHHSPSRIETLTAFYKHPLEIAANSLLIGFIIYSLFGGSALAGAWYAFFAATGEYFYHTNIKTPRWMGYFIQRPEQHSIHHQLDVHHYNFGDVPLWDRLFGTFKEAEVFVPRCGFPKDNERKLMKMLLFKDVYKD